MADGKPVEIKPAKGRPMLTWVGKCPLRNVIAYPAQLVETLSEEVEVERLSPNVDWSDWPQMFPKGGLLFHGDNKDVLAYLLANGFRGKVNLVYIDPPFNSGADYVRKVNLRGLVSTAKVDGAGYELGEQIQYTDIWANDNYLQFMYERLMLIKELLSDDGSIYLHCDWHKSHHLRCLLDEIFGSEQIRNEIIWKRTSARSDSKTFNHIHDTILLYSKGSEIRWNRLLLPNPEDYLERYYNYSDGDGRRFMALNLTAPGLRNGSTGLPWRGFEPRTQSNHWKYTIDNLEQLDQEGKIYWPDKDGGWPRLKRYLDQAEGRAIQSIWDDIYTVNSQAIERTDYPTQKSEDLLERIILSSSYPGDLVLDCFIGSGTTSTVAQRLGRRWIGADINKGAIQTTTNCLQSIILEQSSDPIDAHGVLPEDEREPQPCQLSFSIYRINDYDLQIQHNEAYKIAIEHLGMTGTPTDAFFDGVLGKRLVKIIPFNHPLTPLDLEEIKNELANRPEESRGIVVVCLGKELHVDAWLEDWNRIRRQRDFPNKIEVIELHSDPRYGGFFVHEPDEAVVRFERADGYVMVTIENFLSPTIIQRLEQQSIGPLLRPQITNWQAMVDSIMIRF